MKASVHRFYMSTAKFDQNHLCGEGFGHETVIASQITCQACIDILKARKDPSITYHSFNFGPNAFKQSCCGVPAPFQWAIAFIDEVNCPQCMEYQAVRKIQFEAFMQKPAEFVSSGFVDEMTPEQQAARKAKMKADRAKNKV